MTTPYRDRLFSWGLVGRRTFFWIAAALTALASLATVQAGWAHPSLLLIPVAVTPLVATAFLSSLRAFTPHHRLHPLVVLDAALPALLGAWIVHIPFVLDAVENALASPSSLPSWIGVAAALPFSSPLADMATGLGVGMEATGRLGGSVLHSLAPVSPFGSPAMLAFVTAVSSLVCTLFWMGLQVGSPRAPQPWLAEHAARAAWHAHAERGALPDTLRLERDWMSGAYRCRAVWYDPPPFQQRRVPHMATLPMRVPAFAPEQDSPLLWTPPTSAHARLAEMHRFQIAPNASA